MPRIISAGWAHRKLTHKKDQARKRFARITFGLVIFVLRLLIGKCEFAGLPYIVAADDYGELVGLGVSALAVIAAVVEVVTRTTVRGLLVFLPEGLLVLQEESGG